MSSIPVNQNVFIPNTPGGQFLDFAERVIAGILLVITAPLLLGIWLVVLLLSRRSPLIAHRRVGRHGSELLVFVNTG